MRHALTLFPKTPFFFSLDMHSLIMNYELKVEEHIMDKARLEKIMRGDRPIIPPDSVIKTFPHMSGDRVDLVLSQDKDGLLPNSFILRRGEWAKFFLDAWFDPIYRSYNFQKAERHALEHIVQYVTRILARDQNADDSQTGGTARCSRSWRSSRRASSVPTPKRTRTSRRKAACTRPAT